MGGVGEGGGMSRTMVHTGIEIIPTALWSGLGSVTIVGL